MKEKFTWKRFFLGIVESIRHRFASFDTFSQLLPTSVINLALWIIFSLIIYSNNVYINGLVDVNLFGGSVWLAKILRKIFNLKISVDPGIRAMLLSLIITIWLRILYRIGKYFENMWVAIYVFVVEHKRIIKIPLRKKILYVLTWPTFDIIGRYTTYVALFKKVTWKPIPHDSKITINDINGGSK